MKIEDRRLYIKAQIALLNANIARMEAENSYRISKGLSPAYSEDDFEEIIQKYEDILTLNNLVDYLADH